MAALSRPIRKGKAKRAAEPRGAESEHRKTTTSPDTNTHKHTHTYKYSIHSGIVNLFRGFPSSRSNIIEKVWFKNDKQRNI